MSRSDDNELGCLGCLTMLGFAAVGLVVLYGCFAGVVYALALPFKWAFGWH